MLDSGMWTEIATGAGIISSAVGGAWFGSKRAQSKGPAQCQECPELKVKVTTLETGQDQMMTCIQEVKAELKDIHGRITETALNVAEMHGMMNERGKVRD